MTSTCGERGGQVNVQNVREGQLGTSGSVLAGVWWEVLLIVGIIFLYAGGPPPDVNEAHYLVKAKHYWNPGSYGPDVFLDSADPHIVYYWILGWVTQVASLTATAWIGRMLAWLLLAFAWQRLSWELLPQRYVSVVTAGLFLVLSDYGHLAGEWAVGGAEAKSLAWALVLLGWRSVVAGHWRGVWLWLGAASAIHVLVGGWSVVAAAMTWWMRGADRASLRSMLPALLLGGVLSLGGLLPALRLSAGADSGVLAESDWIYVFGRLPHHLVFHRFAWERLAWFTLLLLIWAGLSWYLRQRVDAWRRLNQFAVAALGISAVGVVIDVATLGQPGWAAALLRYYWFRLADVAVPVTVAMGMTTALIQWVSGHPRWLRPAWAVAMVVPSVFLLGHFASLQMDFRPGAVRQSQPVGRRGAAAKYERYRDWRAVCQWIKEQTPQHARFLTPRNEQTFKWYAGQAELACWKDIPQDAESIVRWWRLLQEVYPQGVVEHGLGWWTDEELRRIAARYELEYILADSTHGRLLGLQRVYPLIPSANRHFAVYRIFPKSPGAEAVERESQLPVTTESDEANRSAGSTQ